jgi:hypothetical protein
MNVHGKKKAKALGFGITRVKILAGKDFGKCSLIPDTGIIDMINTKNVVFVKKSILVTKS